MPINVRTFGISIFCPRYRLRLQPSDIFHSLSQTLTSQNAYLNFSHIQPDAVFVSVMNLEPVSNAFGFCRLKCLMGDGNSSLRTVHILRSALAEGKHQISVFASTKKINETLGIT